MNRFEILLENVNDFIPNLAKDFKIGYKCKLSEYTLLVPKRLGKGKITAVNFYNGLSLYTFHVTFEEDTVISLKKPANNFVRLVHCLQGTVINSNQSLEKEAQIQNHEYFFISPRPGEVHEITFLKGRETRIFYLEIERTRFRKFLPFRMSEVEPLFHSLFKEGNGLEEKFYSGKFSLKVSDIIREVFECEEVGLPRIHFLRAKALEVLSYMLSRYRKEKGGGQESLSNSDYKAVKRLTNHISENLKDLHTNPELAHMVGVNLNKLQNAFQTVYGQTLNEFIRDTRLSRALELILKGENSIGEIVEEIGLNSRSYFSKIFRNKYGVLPREMLKHETSLTVQEEKSV